MGGWGGSPEVKAAKKCRFCNTDFKFLAKLTKKKQAELLCEVDEYD